jgi:hypothetical protein
MLFQAVWNEDKTHLMERPLFKEVSLEAMKALYRLQHV